MWMWFDVIWTLALCGGSWALHRVARSVGVRKRRVLALEVEARFYRDEREAEFNAFKAIDFVPQAAISDIPGGTDPRRVLSIEGLPPFIRQDIEEWWNRQNEQPPKRTQPDRSC